MENGRKYEQDLRILKEWYSKQPHLPKNIDDKLLISFISGTKTLEQCKEKLDGYLSQRNEIFDLFRGLGPTTEDFAKYFKAVGMFFLDGTTPEGWTVLIIAPFKYSTCSVDTQLVTQLSLLEVILDMHPHNTLLASIVDYKHLTSSIIKEINFSHLSNFIKHILTKMPFKIKKSISINTPSWFSIINRVIEPLLSQKLRERMKYFSDDYTLTDFYPAEMLPSDYGGKGPSSEQLLDKWYKIMVERQDWFAKREELFQCDESKRPKDSAFRKDREMFGVEGSFKTLHID